MTSDDGSTRGTGDGNGNGNGADDGHGHGHAHGPAHGRGPGPADGHAGADTRAHTRARAHAHAHAHADRHGAGAGPGPGEPDWDAMAAHLERDGEVQLPGTRQAAGWLRELLAGGPAPAEPAPGSPREPLGPASHGAAATRTAPRAPHAVRRVLDVGSGPGVAACVLAETFPGAEVVAVDASPFLLERARQRAARAGIGADRFVVLPADLPADFDALGRADLIWSSRALHHVGDQQLALRQLAGVLSDGGLLAVAEGGLPLRFLPRDIGLGRPGLQARLDAAEEERFAAMRAGLPGAADTTEDWPAMLEHAGLTPAGSHTFLVQRPAPLDAATRDHLRARLARLREGLAEELAADDVQVLDALLDDDAPTGILRRPDAFYLNATTVHTAWARRAS